jgi:hypothetical protein
MERSHRVALAATQEVGALGHGVHPMEVFVKPRGKERGNGTRGADRVCRRFKVAHVEPVQGMVSHRKVDGGRLIGVDVDRIVVVVFLGRQDSPIFH